MRRPADPRKGVWETPDWLFKPLHQLLRFDLDAAADAKTKKCTRYFSQARSALTRPWDGSSTWCNPPYGCEPGTEVWVERGRYWARYYGNRVTMLLPVKADTTWYHELVWGQNRVVDSGVLRGPVPGRWYRLEEAWGYVELLELRGRVDFGDTKKPGWFASSVVLFNAGRVPVLPGLERLAPMRRAAQRSGRVEACT
jgi:phage N-6-adenine-methyltransferase